MKKRILQINLVLLFTIISFVVKSQVTPVWDKWDTLNCSVSYTFPVNNTYYFWQNDNLPVNNKLLMYGDSVNQFTFGSNSYLSSFNPSTNSLTVINYARSANDIGMGSGASVNTNTANLSYSFFGAKVNQSLYTDYFTLYKLNSQTSAVTSETVNFAPNFYHRGILNLCFFSPTTNHDSLMIFNHTKVGTDSIFIYKKHYNQIGITNSNNKLPEPLQEIKKSFVFNNVLYISGRNGGSNYLFNSSNGTTFTTNTAYTYSTASIIDMDTLNNELYLGIYDSDGFYNILKTVNGTSFTALLSWPNGVLTSLKKFQGKIWYSLKNNQISSKPTVMYLTTPSNSLSVTSIDTIGRPMNDGDSFFLNTLNNSLLFSGNYIDMTNNAYGTSVYKFLPPAANFTLSNTQFCLNSTHTTVSTSLNTDSVRWVLDNNFYAATTNSFSFQFNTTGSHTVGLIAIAGTQKDTLKYTVNVYSVSASINAPATACQNTPFQITSTNTNAIGAVTYSWTQSPPFASGTYSTQNILVGVAIPGAYNYYLQVKDINNCIAVTNTVFLSVYSSKDISGVVTTATALPVNGDVVLYKYQPILTKFDSVTYQPLNASGNYTFSTIDSGTYIVKCIPSATSLQITYGNSAISWKNATILTHGCINSSSQNINVIPLTNLGVGTGVLAGTITEGIGYGQKTNGVRSPGAPIKGVIVKGGRNPGGDITTQSKTNAAGQYTLSGLPSNLSNEDYFVLVDIPGLDTNTTYHRIITSTNFQFIDLDFVVDSAKITPLGNFVGVKEVSLDKNKVRLYPNPTSGNITIEFDLFIPSTVMVEVMDVLGRSVKTILPLTYKNENEIKISSNLSEINSGVYFVKIKIGETERTTKIILTK